mgnify:CR=1 FL=1
MTNIRIKIPAVPAVLWFLFMVLVVAPSFMTAAFIEEARTFGQAAHWTNLLLTSELYFPEFMASIFKYPVAAIGMILPSSASLIMAPFEFFLQGSGPILTYIFFAGVSRPFSLLSKQEQEELEEQGEQL